MTRVAPAQLLAIMDSYDYIIVGAGSAGCVIANRLVRAGHIVLLLESGKNDQDYFMKIPGGLQKISASHSWSFSTEPQPFVNDRRIFMKQGRVVGGGSSINGMVYIRGQAEDYDDWERDGCEGWGWQNVLPVFKKLEANQRYSEPYHGTEGELNVSDANYRHPLSYAFVRAAQEAGLPYNDDFNGSSQAGVGFYQVTCADGLRRSAASAFLRSVEKNPQLTIRSSTHVERILTADGAASGVRYRASDNSVHESAARQEVIIAAGAFGSPQLLQLSGIGPGALLSRHDIDPVRVLDGVGANFHDHFQASVYGQTKRAISLHGADKGLRAAGHGLQWLLFKSGLLTSNIVESGGFASTRGTARPDVQFTVLPVLTGDADRTALPGHGISIGVCDLRPRARGSVQIASKDVAVPPLIDANALGDAEDMATLVRGVRLARRILHSPSLARLLSHELQPGRGEVDLSDAVIEEHIRRVLKTNYHPAGTCRMGRADDPNAVVDTKLRVHGVPRLRVADASIMPTLVSGNTNAPAIMIGERCANFILNQA